MSICQDSSDTAEFLASRMQALLSLPIGLVINHRLRLLIVRVQNRPQSFETT